MNALSNAVNPSYMSQVRKDNDRAIDVQEQRVVNIDAGYTRLANELYDALIGANLTKIQARVAHAICRKTYGFNKKMDRIADSQLAELTRLPRQKVNKAKNELISMNVLIKSHHQIGLNKHLSEWSIPICQKNSHAVIEIETNYSDFACQQKNNIVSETGTTYLRPMCHQNADIVTETETTCSQPMCHQNEDIVTKIETRSERQEKGGVVTQTGTENVPKTGTGLWTSSPPSGFTSRYAERARLPHTLHTQAIHALSVHTLIAALPRPERRGLRSMLLDHQNRDTQKTLLQKTRKTL